jgi:CDP-glucose 4,6-dehydratase
MDLEFLREKYQGKRVLVTGHSGFKGTWLTKILIRIGADVVGFSKDKYNFPQDHKNAPLHSVEGDITADSAIFDVISGFSPEIIFHLAAQPLVYQSYKDPVETFRTNVLGSANLLEAVRSNASVQALVFVTSDKCYQNNEWVWGYRELDRLGGNDPYSASKACAEILFNSYWQSYFKSSLSTLCCSVRAGNVIGGGDWSDDRIVPDAMRALFSGKTLYLRNPNATRPWQHVLEPLSGYLLLGSKLLDGKTVACGSWNFGPADDDIRSVKDVAQALQKLIARGYVDIDTDAEQLHEAGLLN